MNTKGKGINPGKNKLEIEICRKIRKSKQYKDLFNQIKNFDGKSLNHVKTNFKYLLPTLDQCKEEKILEFLIYKKIQNEKQQQLELKLKLKSLINKKTNQRLTNNGVNYINNKISKINDSKKNEKSMNDTTIESHKNNIDMTIQKLMEQQKQIMSN